MAGYLSIFSLTVGRTAKPLSVPLLTLRFVELTNCTFRNGSKLFGFESTPTFSSTEKKCIPAPNVSVYFKIKPTVKSCTASRKNMSGRQFASQDIAEYLSCVCLYLVYSQILGRHPNVCSSQIVLNAQLI